LSRKMLVIANILFQERQEMMLHMDITKWSVLKSDWLYSLQLKIEKIQLTKQNLVTAAMKLKDTCSLEGKNRQTWTEY